MSSVTKILAATVYGIQAALPVASVSTGKRQMQIVGYDASVAVAALKKDTEIRVIQERTQMPVI